MPWQGGCDGRLIKHILLYIEERRHQAMALAKPFWSLTPFKRGYNVAYEAMQVWPVLGTSAKTVNKSGHAAHDEAEWRREREGKERNCFSSFFLPFSRLSPPFPRGNKCQVNQELV